ncbi:MAG: outer membrane protein assembly factor BamB [Rhodocyclales bacterium]|nr:outer membrane protein assembly factor BamB [Rhodocyclales bacterium]
MPAQPTAPARRFAPLLLAAALGLLSGCASLNPFAASAPKPAELTAFAPSGEIRTAWQARIGASGGYVFQPAVVGDSVFAASHDGAVARFQDGQMLWKATVGELSAGVGSDGKLVVVVSTGGDVIALDADSGAQRWRAVAGVEVLAPPAVTASVVVARASDGRLLGFNAADGTRRWVYQRAMPTLSLRNAAGMRVDERGLMVGYPGGKVVALNIENGSLLWELAVASPRGVTELERITDVAGTPVTTRGEICAVAYQGRAGCFDLSNGRALWSREFSSSTGLARDTRFIFIADDGDVVHGLDAFSGASAWKQDALKRRQLTRPIVAGGFVMVADLEGNVHALNRESGQFVARLRTDGSAIVADPQPLGLSRFVVQTRDGGIFALEAQ